MAEIIKHYLISGRVQGVGFRAFTQRLARQLGLSGWVRNLSDGRVEILVNGLESVLMQFEAQLRTGPAHSRVDAVLRSTRPNSESKWVQGSFSVREDGQQACGEN